MFAISFDLIVAETSKNHPKGVAQAYADIAVTLRPFGFERIQGSVYVTQTEDMCATSKSLDGFERCLSYFLHHLILVFFFVCAGAKFAVSHLNLLDPLDRRKFYFKAFAF